MRGGTAPAACTFGVVVSRRGFSTVIDLMPTLSQLLSRHGVSSRNTVNIEPHRDDQGVWRIKFSAPGDPTGVLVDCGSASRLAAELRLISEVALAERIDAAVANAKRFARSPSG